MTIERALLTIGLCFGLGVGLTSTVTTAHACSCYWGSQWFLELDAIDGTDDAASEQAFWRTDAVLTNRDTDDVRLLLEPENTQVQLRPLP